MRFTAGSGVHFNPSQVRSKPETDRLVIVKFINFNPSQVRSKLLLLLILYLIKHSFNPSQVRSKPLDTLQKQRNELMFQSLIGKIKTMIEVKNNWNWVCFNPSQVRSKLLLLLILYLIKHSFNPSQVRSKLLLYILSFTFLHCFNPSQVRSKLDFHYLHPETLNEFQSLIGKIKT